MANKRIRRNYAGDDVSMITALMAIMMAAIEFQAQLVKKDTTLTPQFLEELRQRINVLSNKHLGTDVSRLRREATDIVLNIFDAAYSELMDVKSFIDIKYRRNPAEGKQLLFTLGYTTYLADVRNQDQEALVGLLFQFRDNCDAATIAKLTALGLPESDITDVFKYAKQLLEANVTQEYMKRTQRKLTDEAITDFNNLYFDVTEVAGIGKIVFKRDKAISERFTYSLLLRAMNNNGTPDTDDDDTPDLDNTPDETPSA